MKTAASPVLQGRKRLRKEERGSQDQKRALWHILNEIWRSKIEVPAETFILAVLWLASAGSAFAQGAPAPAFEAASVKLSTGDHMGWSLSGGPGQRMYRDVLCIWRRGRSRH
jgi:hypothetical protein